MAKGKKAKKAPVPAEGYTPEATVDSVIPPEDLTEENLREFEAHTKEMKAAAKRLRKATKEHEARNAIKARPWTIEITITEGVNPKGAVRTTTIADGHMTHGLDYDLIEERELLVESIGPVLATVIRKHTWSVKGYRDLGDTSFLSET